MKQEIYGLSEDSNISCFTKDRLLQQIWRLFTKRCTHVRVIVLVHYRIMSIFALFSKFSRRLPLKYVRHQHVNASRLFLDEFGDPGKVVKKEDFSLELPQVMSTQVIYTLNIFICIAIKTVLDFF
jgi:hypothetical protein